MLTQHATFTHQITEFVFGLISTAHLHLAAEILALTAKKLCKSIFKLAFGRRPSVGRFCRHKNQRFSSTQLREIGMSESGAGNFAC